MLRNIQVVLFSAFAANGFVFAIIAAVITLAGCGAVDRGVTKWTGTPSPICIDGVTYLQFTSGAAVKVDREGKPVPCKN